MFRFFQKDDSPLGGKHPSLDVEDESPSSRRRLKCVKCALPITSEDARFSHAGAFSHTFANPKGQVFTVGCFGTAEGLIPVGEPSNQFSWFPGYSWQVVVCTICHLHLGWRFESKNDVFYALILDRLKE